MGGNSRNKITAKNNRITLAELHALTMCQTKEEFFKKEKNRFFSQIMFPLSKQRMLAAAKLHRPTNLRKTNLSNLPQIINRLN